MSELYNKALWLNKTEHLSNVECTDSMTFFRGLQANMINGFLNLEDQFLLNRTNEVQKIKKVVVRNSCGIENLEYQTLNNLDRSNIKEMMNPEENSVEKPNLRVEGNVEFKVSPIFENLNDFDLKQLHDNVWLSNRETVLSASKIFFQNFTKFENNIVSKVS